jgi:hypothetical protein
MAIDTGSERRAVIARAALAQTPAELESAIAAVERLLDEEPGDPELETLLRGLDAAFTRLTHDPVRDDEPSIPYHPERDPGFV